jgi:hypothetical protein
MNQIEAINAQLTPLKEQLSNHKLYQAIQSAKHVQLFMEHHVYAVWDFMSLLKSLQVDLTCVQIPWRPIGNANTRFLINEIVCGEESDIDSKGNRISHFEMYLNAMKEVGADTSNITIVIEQISTSNFKLENLNQMVPSAVFPFVNNTLNTALNAPTHVKAGVFTFGREDLIPTMFISMVHEFNKQLDNKFDSFLYYLERHIEVDGSHHSHLALEMTSSLCGDDEIKWNEVQKASEEALKQRINLWDQIYWAIQQH